MTVSDCVQDETANAGSKVVASLFLSPGGPKFISLMLQLANHVMLQEMKTFKTGMSLRNYFSPIFLACIHNLTLMQNYRETKGCPSIAYLNPMTCNLPWSWHTRLSYNVQYFHSQMAPGFLRLQRCPLPPSTWQRRDSTWSPPGFWELQWIRIVFSTSTRDEPSKSLIVRLISWTELDVIIYLNQYNATVNLVNIYKCISCIACCSILCAYVVGLLSWIYSIFLFRDVMRQCYATTFDLHVSLLHLFHMN